MATDTSLLQAALVGYEAQVQRINAAIADLQKRLGVRRGRRVAPIAGPSGAASQPKRKLSAAARARIAEAQRRRWANYRRKNAKTMTAGRAI